MTSSSAGFYVSATRMSSGKTTLSIGLARAIVRQGHALQTFKKGPDYIDGNWLAAASERACYNLDFNVQNNHELIHCYKTHSAELQLVEGNKGLFDSVDTQGTQSNAALARILNTPIVLVIDCQGITRGIAPLLLGYTNFEDVHYEGVILNKVGSSRHQSKLIAAVETYTDLNVLGCVERNNNMHITERHLGLVTGAENPDIEQCINLIADNIEQQVDVSKLIELARPTEPKSTYCYESCIKTSIVIGIAKDRAFNFYYQDDLDEMQRQGATLIYFSPLDDKQLPDVDAVFIGGGFPEIFAHELALNISMKQSIVEYIEAGGVAYAECGGLMYLSEYISVNGQTHTMTGVLKGNTSMQERPVGRGLVKLCTTASHPWFASEKGEAMNAHEFHHSTYTPSRTVDSKLNFAFEIQRGYGINGGQDGLVYKNLLANYVHQRNTSQNPWVLRFIEFIKQNVNKK